MARAYTMDLNYTLASDDSCELKIYTRGHFNESEFKRACIAFYLDNWERKLNPSSMPVKHAYWRSVRAAPDNIVSDRCFVESAAGRGAFPVTILDAWLPLHAA